MPLSLNYHNNFRADLPQADKKKKQKSSLSFISLELNADHNLLVRRS